MYDQLRMFRLAKTANVAVPPSFICENKWAWEQSDVERLALRVKGCTGAECVSRIRAARASATLRSRTKLTNDDDEAHTNREEREQVCRLRVHWSSFGSCLNRRWQQPSTSAESQRKHGSCIKRNQNIALV